MQITATADEIRVADTMFLDVDWCTMTNPEIPGWEFENKERSPLASVLFPRHSEPEPIFEPTLDAAYLDIDRGVRRLVRRLTDYDAETFAQAA